MSINDKSFDITDDPFAPEADPYPPKKIALERNEEEQKPEPVDCHCSDRRSVTRRQALIGLSLIASSPVLAQVETAVVPCRPERQRLNPCKHKFCKYYGGVDDYYDR